MAGEQTGADEGGSAMAELRAVATSGETQCEWAALKAIVAARLQEVAADYYATCKDIDGVSGAMPRTPHGATHGMR